MTVQAADRAEVAKQAASTTPPWAARTSRTSVRGINIASAVVSLLADELAPSAAPALPTRRTAALIEAVHGLPTNAPTTATTGTSSLGQTASATPCDSTRSHSRQATPRPRRVAPLPGRR